MLALVKDRDVECHSVYRAMQAKLGEDIVEGIPGEITYETIGIMTLALFKYALLNFDSRFILKVGFCTTSPNGHDMTSQCRALGSAEGVAVASTSK